MATVLFRRRRIGLTSCRAIQDLSSTGIITRTHNPLLRTARREGPWPEEVGTVIRWGCTALLPNRTKVINKAEAISLVGDKARFRMILNEHGLCPPTAVPDWGQDATDLPGSAWVVRPRRHSQGRRLGVCNTYRDMLALVERYGPHAYVSTLINKTHEYRVFVAQGRAVWVANKTPGDSEDVGWNVDRGGRFDSVRWGNWPLKAVKTSIEAFKLSGLDFGGVDVMVDGDGRAYVLEINSAPSLTSPYRQECTAKALDWMVTHGTDTIDLVEERGGWRKFIHPAISSEATLVIEE